MSSSISNSKRSSMVLGFYLFMTSKIRKPSSECEISLQDLAKDTSAHLSRNTLDTHIPDVFLVVDMLTPTELDNFNIKSLNDLEVLFNNPTSLFGITDTDLRWNQIENLRQLFGVVPNNHLDEIATFMHESLNDVIMATTPFKAEKILSELEDSLMKCKEELQVINDLFQ